MSPEEHEATQRCGWRVCTVVDAKTGAVWDDVFPVREVEVWDREALYAAISNRAGQGDPTAIMTLRHMVRSTQRKRK